MHSKLNYLIFRKCVVVGILKMGWKKLYLFDKKGSRSEAMVYCLLDFYIHETRQRQGYGNKLFEHMLKVCIIITLTYYDFL
jgi:GNAT superfamily N-acetyltransferase